MIRRALQVLIAFATASAAQDLTPKAPPQTKPVLIVGATIHPVSRPSSAGSLRFEGGRITAIGDIAARPGDEIVDGTGRHVYPGFVSPWTQLGLTEIGSVRPTHDFDETGAVTPEALAVVAVNPDSWLLPVVRRNGVLTALTAPSGGAIAGRASVIRMDGWTTDDLALLRDAGVVVSWPRMRTGGGRGRFGGRPAAEPAEGDPADDVRRAVALIEDAFKEAEAYMDAREIDPTRSVDVRWEAMRGVIRPEAGARPKPVFALADDVEQIQAAVSFAARRKVKLVIVGGRSADACADLLKAHGVPVVLSGVFQMPKRSDADYDEAFTRPKRLQEVGVAWCLASGEETAHERNLPYAAGLAAAYGLDRAAALRGITLSAAEILGVGDRVGSLDVGKQATLFLADGDPLKVQTQIERAWIDGRNLVLQDKQTALYEKYRQKYGR